MSANATVHLGNLAEILGFGQPSMVGAAGFCCMLRKVLIVWMSPISFPVGFQIACGVNLVLPKRVAPLCLLGLFIVRQIPVLRITRVCSKVLGKFLQKGLLSLGISTFLTLTGIHVRVGHTGGIFLR